MKKLLKALSLLFILSLTILSSVFFSSVYASRIEIDDDNNFENIIGLSLDNEKTFIQIDDTLNIGYVIHRVDDDLEVIGTCTVIIINSNYTEEYVLCYGQNDSLGVVTIMLDNDSTSNGYIYSLTDGLSSIFSVNQIVSIIE
ncbi:MAG: hypothetical protein ACI32E_02215 [Bacilli bacterium]